MLSHSVLSLAFLVAASVAAPSFPAVLRSPLDPRDPDGCGPTFEDQTYIADIGYYSDHDCTEKIGHNCVYTVQAIADGAPGSYGCNPGLLPSTTPFYAKVEESPYNEMQIVFTRDQTCPPNGPGAVFATLIDNRSCVAMNLGGGEPGVSVFPHGGSGIARREEPPAALARRADPKCKGFNIESSSPSSSQSVQVSIIIDCVNGADGGCSITVEQQHSESVSTSYSATAGGGIEGIFSVEATFGQEFTETSSTTVATGESVPKGQKGYLSAYSSATLFKGTFTGCDSGPAEQPGQVLAIKANGFTYSVVLTGATKSIGSISGGIQV